MNIPLLLSNEHTPCLVIGRYQHTRPLLVHNCALSMAQKPYKLALHLIIALVALLSGDLLPAILRPMVKAHSPQTVALTFVGCIVNIFVMMFCIGMSANIH